MHDMLRFVAGGDRILSLAATNDGNYPPHNLIRIDDATYEIEIAATGFSREEISVQLSGDTLTVSATRGEREPKNFLHRGLATRSFTRQFRIMDAKIEEACLQDGVLTIRLVREHLKPEVITITVK